MFSETAFAQFAFSVSKTDETCVGNATLTFQLNNTNPSASYLFVIYKLPNTTTPYLSTSSLNVQFLSHGNYQIDAIETLDGNSVKITRQVTINHLVEPLMFYVNEIPTPCNGITLEIVTTAGNPVSYEIFEGPTIYPLQESNVFMGLLPDETYQIRIYDDCGEGYVRTHTVETEVSNYLVFFQSEQALVACDTVQVTYIISSSEFLPNHEITYTLIFPDGSQSEYTQVVDIPEGISENTMNLPFDPELEVDCVLQFLNPCGEVDYLGHNLIVPDIILNEGSNVCGNVYFSIFSQGYLAPYTFEFVDYPDDFNPVDFNENHPLHYEDKITYGMFDNPLPLGSYTILFTDSCGSSVTIGFESEHERDDTAIGFGNQGCASGGGYFTIRFVGERVMVEATIVSGPDILGDFPISVSEHINENGQLRCFGFPPGEYEVTFVDSCGFDYVEIITIPEFELFNFTASSFISCEDMHGTLRLSSPNGHLVNAVITSAPEGFPYDLPYDAFGHINAVGALFMANMPSGNYTVQANDTCEVAETITVFVKGDEFNTAPHIIVEKQCNIFDLTISMPQGHSFNDSYWFQYYNENTGQWEHPFTGVAYPEGTIPTEENAIQLIPYDIDQLLNIGLFGQFRIVKTFKEITSDSPFRTEDCIKTDYYTFTYDMNLTITNAYRIICEGQYQTVAIQAEGIAPLTYYIVQKDGLPFFVNNGQSNVFSGLEPGIYTFQVRDNCGNIRNREYNLEEIELMSANGQADNLIACSDEETNNYTFHLSGYNIYLVASTLSLEYFTIQYFSNYTNAVNQVGQLPDELTLTAGSIQVYARIENQFVPGCFSIAHFTVGVIETPDVSGIETQYVLCEDAGSIVLSVPDVYDEYLWSTGSNQNSVEVTQSGTYIVTVGNSFEGVTCQKDIEIYVVLSGLPQLQSVDYVDWTYQENVIAIQVSGSGEYVYSLDGITYQSNPVFENLAPGLYTVYVNDLLGCGTLTTEVLLLNYPKFFTPNGDGYNDYWQIQYGYYEPEMRICIFDRYGKLITVFMGNSQGWDGTYNGRELPSTDYWFVVERKDGIIRKGHFSMKR